jgi:hypothetical protein
MANNSEENKPSEGEGATAAGMVEAVTQNVELIVDRVMDTAEGAVVAVQEKLGMRKPPRRAKPAKPKAKAAQTAKPSKVAKPQASKAVKAKPSKIAKSMKATPSKSAKPSMSAKLSKSTKSAKSATAKAAKRKR